MPDTSWLSAKYANMGAMAGLASAQAEEARARAHLFDQQAFAVPHGYDVMLAGADQRNQNIATRALTNAQTTSEQAKAKLLGQEAEQMPVLSQLIGSIMARSGYGAPDATAPAGAPAPTRQPFRVGAPAPFTSSLASPYQIPTTATQPLSSQRQQYASGTENVQPAQPAPDQRTTQQKASDAAQAGARVGAATGGPIFGAMGYMKQLNDLAVRLGFATGTESVPEVNLKKGTPKVPGKGSPKVDSVPAKLAPGEAVLNAPAADMAGRGLIAALNKVGAQKLGMA